MPPPASQIDLTGPTGSRPLRLPIRGRGLLPRLLPTPRLLHFGVMGCGEWGDQLVTLVNGCAELPLRVVADTGSPYFKVWPPGAMAMQCNSQSRARVLTSMMGHASADASCVAWLLCLRRCACRLQP
jgi:hypothetical protein